MRELNEIPLGEYYAGIWDAILYAQADQDTERKKDERPTVIFRLPSEYGPCFNNDLEFVFHDFIEVLANHIDDEAHIVSVRTLDMKDGEIFIEVGSTEGYQGLPDDWPEEVVW